MKLLEKDWYSYVDVEYEWLRDFVHNPTETWAKALEQGGTVISHAETVTDQWKLGLSCFLKLSMPQENGHSPCFGPVFALQMISALLLRTWCYQCCVLIFVFRRASGGLVSHADVHANSPAGGVVFGVDMAGNKTDGQQRAISVKTNPVHLQRFSSHSQCSHRVRSKSDASFFALFPLLPSSHLRLWTSLWRKCQIFLP